MNHSEIENIFGTKIKASKFKPLDGSGVILVKKSLVITLNYAWVFTGTDVESCTPNLPPTIYAQVFSTPPGGIEKPIITIQSSDMFPGGSCVGTYNATQSAATPLSDGPGVYQIRFNGLNATQHAPNGEIFVITPSILILVDGDAVINKAYPALLSTDSTSTAGDSWVFSFGP